MTGLNDKTVVLAGPFGLLLQNLISRLSEHGASVAVVTDDIKSCQRVCQNIMDMREVSEKYGRAAAIEGVIKDDSSASNAFSRSAEIFGGIDVYIDTHLWGLSIPFLPPAAPTEIDGGFQAAFHKLQLMTNVAAAYLKARSRGRILYAFHEIDKINAEKSQVALFQPLIDLVHHRSRELVGQNTTVNALAIGVNEEYLITRFAKSLTIQKALQEFAKTRPGAKLVDYNEIASFISFLVSPGSGGLSGQILAMNHGV